MNTLASELLAVANKYEITHLFTICEHKLKSNVNADNFIELLVLADLHNATVLKRACLIYDYWRSPSVFSTSHWKKFKENYEGHMALLMEIIEFAP